MTNNPRRHKPLAGESSETIAARKTANAWGAWLSGKCVGSADAAVGSTDGSGQGGEGGERSSVGAAVLPGKATSKVGHVAICFS